jgi:16S rRNA G966 N2-methylase RsmD
MRIVAGAWAGHPLVSPGGRVRPTSEGVREVAVTLALDALLRSPPSERDGDSPPGVGPADGASSGAPTRRASPPSLRLADLFAGTGAVGLELLSRTEDPASGLPRSWRGATLDLVESDPSALHALKANARGLPAAGAVRDRIRVLEQDAIRWSEHPSHRPWDVALADPPWGSGKVERLLSGWRRRPFARVLVLEHAADHALPPELLGLRSLHRVVGDAVVSVFHAPETPPVTDRPRRRAGGAKRSLLLPLLLAGAAAGSGVALAGCGGDDELRAPAPAVQDESDALPGLEPSLLVAPVLYDLAPAVAAMERAVPRTFGSLEERHPHPTHDRVTVAFEVERSPFTWSMVGDTARITTTLRYRGRGWYDPPLAPEVSASCGTSDREDDRPRAVVTLASPLTVDASWRLRSRARLTTLVPASDSEEDACTVTVFGIDVTDRVLEAARGFLEGHLHRVDDEVAGVDLKSRLQGVWDRLLEPHELTDEVWLQILPTTVSLGAIEGVGGQVRLGLGLGATPRIVLGPRPSAEALVLPELGRGTPQEGLRILLEGRANYREAGERITKELEGAHREWGGRTLHFREATLRGIGGGKVALGVRFDGDATGEIFLVGTPALDPDTRVITVPDLDFDLETENLLARSAAWIVRPELRRVLRAAARIPVDDLLDFGKEQLHRGLNRELSDEVRMEGEVLGAELLAVRATVDHLQVHAAAEARATLVVSH